MQVIPTWKPSNRRRGKSVCRITSPQLSVVVVAPAVYTAIGQKGAAVKVFAEEGHHDSCSLQVKNIS